MNSSAKETGLSSLCIIVYISENVSRLFLLIRLHSVHRLKVRVIIVNPAQQFLA